MTVLPKRRSHGPMKELAFGIIYSKPVKLYTHQSLSIIDAENFYHDILKVCWPPNLSRMHMHCIIIIGPKVYLISCINSTSMHIFGLQNVLPQHFQGCLTPNLSTMLHMHVYVVHPIIYVILPVKDRH